MDLVTKRKLKILYLITIDESTNYASMKKVQELSVP